jgi:hypothetical protein
MKAGTLVAMMPRNWERAFGYDGEARYVCFYWTPLGDEAMYDDGQIAADGNCCASTRTEWCCPIRSQRMHWVWPAMRREYSVDDGNLPSLDGTVTAGSAGGEGLQVP